MKKLIICLVLLMTIFCVTGCSGNQVNKEDVKFLTAAEYWWFYDEVTGESEKMAFREDGTFYWGCECGEPIGDSDCYELYDYDKETQVIKLYNEYDDTSMEMKVLDYSDYHLMLEQNDEIKDYTCDNLGLDVANSETYFKDYNMVGWIMDVNNGQAVVGPYDYDGDVEYPENAMKAYDLAEDITDIEKELLFEFTKHNTSEYTHLIIRSRWGRFDYRPVPIPVRKCDKSYFEAGDVVIINGSVPRYKAEVHIVRKPIRNDGTQNYAGRIVPEEMFLLDYLTYGVCFGFIPKK